MRTSLVILMSIGLSSLALAQSDPCSNPSTPRIGIEVMTASADREHSSSARAAQALNSVRVAELRLAAELRMLLPPGVCVVSDEDAFSDPKNFPMLKGAPVFSIFGTPSFTAPGRFALAVDIRAVQGAFVEQNFHIGTRAVLIEDDRDYIHGAQLTWEYYVRTTDFISNFRASKK